MMKTAPKANPQAAELEDRIAGVLLGGAVGDALGLPAEGLHPKRIARLGWSTSPWQHRFIFGRGMISDDTEHTLLVAQATLRSDRDEDLFAKHLARGLRWWFAGLPAGVGLATARACLKLWCGSSPRKSGVFAAGNGPAMRSAVIGARFYDDEDARKGFVTAATQITHTDPKALTGALAIANLTALALRDGSEAVTPARVLEDLRVLAADDEEWHQLIDAMEASHAENRTVDAFARTIGDDRGVSGYIYRTVPVAIYAWVRHRGDYRATIESVLNCGGDTDTVAAIAGNLAGAITGARGIPPEWLDGLRDWPRGRRVLDDFSRELANTIRGEISRPVPWFVPGALPRNLFFLLVVLSHGFLLRPILALRSLCSNRTT